MKRSLKCPHAERGQYNNSKYYKFFLHFKSRRFQAALEPGVTRVPKPSCLQPQPQEGPGLPRGAFPGMSGEPLGPTSPARRALRLPSAGAPLTPRPRWRLSPSLNCFVMSPCLPSKPEHGPSSLISLGHMAGPAGRFPDILLGQLGAGGQEREVPPGQTALLERDCARDRRGSFRKADPSSGGLGGASEAALLGSSHVASLLVARGPRFG